MSTHLICDNNTQAAKEAVLANAEENESNSDDETSDSIQLAEVTSSIEKEPSHTDE